MTLESICKICNKQYRYRFRTDRNRQFCSHECRKKFNRKIITECIICKKTFYRFPSSNKQRCSDYCRNLSMREEHNGPLAWTSRATIEEKLERLLNSFNKKVIKTDNCWKWTGNKDKDNYGRIWFNKKSIGAHRASYMLFKGEIPEGLSVLHKCDNPECTNPTHLFLGTNVDNNIDMMKKNRNKHLSGESHPLTKLKLNDVSKIKELLKSNLSQYKIAKMFNISQSSIWRIKTKKTILSQ